MFVCDQILDRKNAEIEDVKVQHRNKMKEMDDHMAKMDTKSKHSVITWQTWTRNVSIL